jgi:2-octaprenylphenol hydroxylase
MSKARHYDIVIVGAGLVGATLAVTLASAPENKSLSIALIDQGVRPATIDPEKNHSTFDPRVVALSHASISLLQQLDIWPQIVAKRVCPYRSMKVWDHEGTAQINFNAETLKLESLGVIVENNLLLNEVLEVIDGFENITLYREYSLQSINSIRYGKTLHFSNAETLSASLLIAADGAQSSVRELSGIKMRSWAYGQKAIVTTVKTTESHQYTAWQNFLITGPLAFLPLEHESEKYCSIVWSADNDYADELMELGAEEFNQNLGEAFQQRLGEIVWSDKRFCFPLVQRHAVDYVVPQVALVGDAAHTIHPLAGQGVNLGLLDVKALGKEISRASTRGIALGDESILRRYQRQRKGHNLEVMLLMESFKRMFGSRSLSLRWLRNSGMRTLNNFPPLKNWLAKQAIGNL